MVNIDGSFLIGLGAVLSSVAAIITAIRSKRGQS